MLGREIQQYRIVDKIGEGGMGSVWKAEDTRLQRLIAIKAISQHLSMDEEARERFLREAQAASGLNHPNIATVHELLEEGDRRPRFEPAPNLVELAKSGGKFHG